MTHTYYAVAFGHKRGVYESFEEMKQYTKGFSQAVYKKCATKEEAEKFVEQCKPESVSLEVKESADKFFSVPRGKNIGIFLTYDEVKKSHQGYPKEAKMYKKFNSFSQAKEYFDKFSKTESENFNPEQPTSPTSREHKHSETGDELNNEHDTSRGDDSLDSSQSPTPKRVARKRTAGYSGKEKESDEDAEDKKLLIEDAKKLEKQDQELSEPSAQDETAQKVSEVSLEEQHQDKEKKEESEKDMDTSNAPEEIESSKAPEEIESSNAPEEIDTSSAQEGIETKVESNEGENINSISGAVEDSTTQQQTSQSEQALDADNVANKDVESADKNDTIAPSAPPPETGSDELEGTIAKKPRIDDE